MGFYLRKSVRVGPFRFNLSKSGIGVSTGIPGFRIGTGPRGTYVHMGRGGLYYRKTLSPSSSRRQSFDRSTVDTSPLPYETHGPMQAIGSGCVSQMVDSDSASLLAEIEEKRKRIRWWPAVLVFAFVLAYFVIGSSMTPWLTAPSLGVLFFSVIIVHQCDQVKKSVVLMYDLEDASLESYQRLCAAFETMSRCGAVWHITAKGDVYDPKYHAGAGALINRNRISIGYRNPPYVKTNLSVPFLPLGKNSFYLLPDRVLVFAHNGVGAVDYASLRSSASPTRFIEDGSVPFDAQVVDHTWRFVNKNGSPDRRFNNNRQIPICQYEDLRLASSAGIREVLQISRLGTSAHVESAIAQVVRSILQAEEAERERLRKETLDKQAREQHRNSQLEHEQQEKQRELSINACETVTATVMQPEKSSPVELYNALFDLLCCIMVADGRASSREKATIADIMTKLKSGWTGDKCEQRMSDFIAEVRILGFSKVRERSLETLPMFKAAKREGTVTMCIEMVAKADGKVVQREHELCERIAYELRRPASSPR